MERALVDENNFFRINKNIDIYHGYRIFLVSLETNLTCTNIKELIWVERTLVKGLSVQVQLY